MILTEHYSSLPSKTTGLPFTVWVYRNHPGEAITQTPRVYLQNQTDLLPISICESPEFIMQKKHVEVFWDWYFTLREWIIRNRAILLRHWNSEVTTTELIEALQK